MTDSANGVWILAEQTDGRVLHISHELLTRTRSLADKRCADLTAIIFGNEINTEDLRELIARGANTVIIMEAPQLAHFLVEPYAACMLHLMQSRRPEIIIAGATSTGRTLMPYVAAKAHAGLTADCTELDIEEDTGNLLQTRPAIGGNILATIKTPQRRPQMATVRPHSARPAAIQEGRKGELLHLAAPPGCLAGHITYVKTVRDKAEHGLQDADFVVSAGHGVKKAENVTIVQELAESLSAALGASRDIVDRGWLTYPHQVGLSGKTISPRLYIAVGISGAIQHLAGMQTAETIVAINHDPDAQIFSVADFGIVGDLFEIVPILTERIREAQKKP